MTESPKFNFSKLRGRIVEKFGAQSAFAEKMGMSEGTLSFKLSNKSYFTAEEMFRACNLLEIGLNDVKDYFFTTAV